jgi:hypothetical protein
MLPIATIVLLAVSAFAASALAHDERRWRYPATIAVGCAVVLTAWGAGALRKMLQAISLDLHPVITGAAVAIPLCLLLRSLVTRRTNTPRHTPSIDDDPVMRRYLNEKIRRARKRRQEEDAVEDADLRSM